jgi:cytochrome c oxidase subunit 4
MDHAMPHGEQLEHPAPATYIKVAAILTVITAIEVSLYYMPAMRGVLVPLLLIFSAMKFAIVAGWYMHLRFDPVLYARLFLGPLTVAAVIAVVLMLLFGHLIHHAQT